MRTDTTACTWRWSPTRNLWPWSLMQPRQAPAGKSTASRNGAHDRPCADGTLSKVRTSPLFKMCHALFADYPLAVDVVGRGRASSSMILALPDGGDVEFFVLSRSRRLRGASYSLRPWRVAGALEIQPGSVTTSEVVMSAVTCGVPLPRDGSMFGWKSGQDVTALLTFNSRYAPERPEPSWSVMPLADLPETQWPPFTGRHVLGRWFWECHQAGAIVSLDRLITQNPRAVYWVDTKQLLGWDCCVVARNIAVPDGFTLRRGRYVYYEALRAGKAVPALDALLADANKTDLAPQFRATHVRPQLIARR
jgi:hypothetical protein